MKKSKQLQSNRLDSGLQYVRELRGNVRESIANVDLSRFQPLLPIIGGLAVGASASLLLDRKIRGNIAERFTNLDLSAMTESGIGGFIAGWFSDVSDTARDVWNKTGLLSASGESSDSSEEVDLEGEHSQDVGSDMNADEGELTGTATNPVGSAAFDSPKNYGGKRNKHENVHANKNIISNKHVH